MKHLYSAGDVAELLGVARSTVYRWYERGEIRGLKLGRLVRFAEADVADFVDAQRVSTSAPTQDERQLEPQ